eukprot:SAG22_NODE_164_length_16817_cov_61.573573_3_plen_458_part_00
MEPYINVGHSIVASFVDGASGDLFVCSRESGDILKVVKPADGEKASYEVSTPTPLRRRRRLLLLLRLRRRRSQTAPARPVPPWPGPLSAPCPSRARPMSDAAVPACPAAAAAAARAPLPAQVFVNTGGVPNGFAFDPNGVVYICDFAHQAILTLGTADDANDQQLTAIVKDYEGKSLKVRRPCRATGPAVYAHEAVLVPRLDIHSVLWLAATTGAEQRRSGQQGDRLLHGQRSVRWHLAGVPEGLGVLHQVRRLSLSLSCEGRGRLPDSPPADSLARGCSRGCHLPSSPDGRLLQPLALSCLAHPAGLALSPDERTVYVCETMANRVLRFVQKPTGVYHFSVFYQVCVRAWRPDCAPVVRPCRASLAASTRRSRKPLVLWACAAVSAQFGGGLGPTGIACDSAGNLFVARFDFAARGDAEGPSSSSPGVVSVLSSKGALLKEVECPASEVSGIVVSG